MSGIVANDRRIAILIGLTLALIVPLLRPDIAVASLAKLDTLTAREAALWGLAALVMLYSLMVEGRGPASVGLRRPDWKTFAFGVLGAIAVIAVAGSLIMFGFPLLHLQQNAEALKELLDTPFAYRLGVVARAGVVEEFLFRGYAIERLQELTGSRVIAGAVPLAVFAVGHLAFWGPAQILVAAAAGLVLTLLYLWRRDLVSNMIAHFLVDALSVLTH